MTQKQVARVSEMDKTHQEMLSQVINGINAVAKGLAKLNTEMGHVREQLEKLQPVVSQHTVDIAVIKNQRAMTRDNPARWAALAGVAMAILAFADRLWR